MTSLLYFEKGKNNVKIIMNQGTLKQVELIVKASNTIQKVTSAEPIEELMFDIIDKNTYEKQPYNINTQRQIKTIVKYNYIDLVNFILNLLKTS